MTESLWNHTIDAAIARDPDASKALEKAAKATATLARLQRSKSSMSSEDRMTRQAATSAVKASIKSCNVAATKAFRETDVIVSTLTGAADPRLMAACGLDQDTENGDKDMVTPVRYRTLAPDGLPPLSLPFVIVDEACQSLEPASLIPIVSSNSCRSVVLLGDPCQLPPTVIHSLSESSPLSISLMERLASTLQPPNIPAKDDPTVHETSFLDCRPVREACSVIATRNRKHLQRTYKKRFAGSFLLSKQYRMHPSIAAFPSAIFYNGLLATPKDLSSARTFPPVLTSTLPCQSNDVSVRVVNIGGRCNERRNTNEGQRAGQQETSYANEKEADFVKSLIRSIVDENDGSTQSLGVISPYTGQVQLLQSLFPVPETQKSSISIEIRSVDSFQGRERDIVIFSAVRSNREGRIGFLNDWRRLNVALTRARKGLVIVGDFDTLAPADAHWDALHKWASGARCIIEAN